MQAQHKKFINGIAGLTAETTAFMLINKLQFAVCNVSMDKAGNVTLTTISDFAHAETFTLNKDEQAAWDLFNDFNTPKNAMNVIMDCIENKAPVTPASFKDQGKITAKATLPKARTFTAFYSSLTAEQKDTFMQIAKNWLADFHKADNSFAFFYVNGENGVTLKAGDYILGYDPGYGQKFAARVFQAAPNGFVSVTDNGGIFSIGKLAAPQICKREDIPEEVAEILDNTYNDWNEKTETFKADRLDKAMKAAERAAELQKEEEAREERKFGLLVDKALKMELIKADEKTGAIKIEKTSYKNKAAIIEAENRAELTAYFTKAINAAAKAAEAQKATDYAKLQAMKLNTPDAIRAASALLNASKLGKEQTEEQRARIKEANAKLKAKTTPAPAAATTAPAQARATRTTAAAPAKETAPKAARAMPTGTPKATAPAKTAKAKK